ncbi:unnamed protein product [Mytilus coruscus]|uniref:Uncharacterized protein n=1 Tax=Mytilus coruscus TaxID=42192 RepID=A0A6J8BA33_MYTCO|nr:unnamed protein product [Mytilus coruscus]
MAKCRALKRRKDALPSTPRKKQAILQHYMCVSPTAKQSLKRQSPSLSEKVLENMKGFIQETKQKRYSDARNAMYVISASVSGEKISKGEKTKQRKCMEFRKNLHASNLDLTQENLPVFEHLNDKCAETLCDKTAPHAQCLNRPCKECGVEKLSFHDNELDTSRNARDIKWENIEYTEINVKGRKTRTKLMLVSKKTKPGEMFNHFKSLLETFPGSSK